MFDFQGFMYKCILFYNKTLGLNCFFFYSKCWEKNWRCFSLISELLKIVVDFNEFVVGLSHASYDFARENYIFYVSLFVIRGDVFGFIFHAILISTYDP